MNFYINDIIKNSDIKILETKEISVEDIYKIPENIYGAYIITVESGKIYVGRSSKGLGIRQRCYSHFHESWIKKLIKKIDVYITEDGNQAISLEKTLINWLNPELNTYLKKAKKDKVLEDFLTKNDDFIDCRKVKNIEKSAVRQNERLGRCSECKNRPIDFVNSNARLNPESLYTYKNISDMCEVERFEFFMSFDTEKFKNYRKCPISKWTKKAPFKLVERECYNSDNDAGYWIKKWG